MNYKKGVLICVLLTLFSVYLYSLRSTGLSLREYLPKVINFNLVRDYPAHHDVKTKTQEDFFALRKDLNLTPVGEIIFRNQRPPERRSKIYKIVIWEVGSFLEARHIYSFTDKWRDPFGQCSVNNCELSYKDEDLPGADAVVFLLQRLKGVNTLPNTQRSPFQRWVFLTDECPQNTFLYPGNFWKSYEGIFNWSMTYRFQSDVPVPYGRTLSLPESLELSKDLGWEDRFNTLVPNAKNKRRDVLAAVLMSNCGSSNKRLQYVYQLEKYIKVDVYGACGNELKRLCPQRGRSRDSRYGGKCPPLEKYLFYLSFENSNCHEYISEKPFWNAYATGAVPVIMGPSQRDSQLILPPNSYLHVENFPSAKDLANHLLFLNSTMESYMDLQDWRRNFEARNEHGLFGTPSMHYCRLCEALNYNSEEPKVYDDLSYFLNPVINSHRN